MEAHTDSLCLACCACDRPYELIAIASSTSLSIWSVQSPALSGGLAAVKLLGSFTEHEGEVCFLHFLWHSSSNGFHFVEVFNSSRCLD